MGGASPCIISPPLLVSPSFWPPPEELSRVYHGLLRHWEQTGSGFPVMMCYVLTERMGTSSF